MLLNFSLSPPLLSPTPQREGWGLSGCLLLLTFHKFMFLFFLFVPRTFILTCNTPKIQDNLSVKVCTYLATRNTISLQRFILQLTLMQMSQPQLVAIRTLIMVVLSHCGDPKRVSDFEENACVRILRRHTLLQSSRRQKYSPANEGGVGWRSDRVSC